ncbi:MAG: S41 family peptidase, partial [Longimicrobiales bacterium]
VVAPVRAQERSDSGLDDTRRNAVIEALIGELVRAYVFPEKADAMAADLRARLGRGEYGAVTQRGEFARVLTEHLQAVSHDKHLRVRVDQVGGGSGPPSGSAPPAAFGRGERLEGDVAYIEITSFGFPPEAVRERTRELLSAAADAAALIIDLRRNGGGHPGMVALVSSYLFGNEPVHLNSLYWRPANRTDDFFTDPKVEGRKFGPDKPVYVLTSSRTFSAAEEFAYNLQSRKRASIVGETTGGGAHPGGGVRLPHGFFMFVPSGRAINPITRTNWEGTGVKPEVAVPADSALSAAHRLARQQANRRT